MNEILKFKVGDIVKPKMCSLHNSIHLYLLNVRLAEVLVIYYPDILLIRITGGSSDYQKNSNTKTLKMNIRHFELATPVINHNDFYYEIY